MNDALAYVNNAWIGLTEGAGTWSAAKGHFVDIFSRLILKSATQVGSNTSRSFADLNAFVSAVSKSEGESLFAGERVAPV